jgi:hypothetical protein
MPSSEIIVLGGPPVPMRRLLEELDAIAADLPDEPLREAVLTLRSAADKNLCRVMCSGAWWPCRRIDESMIPGLRQIAEHLQWQVDFRLGTPDVSGETPIDHVPTIAMREPLSHAGIAWLSASVGLVAAWLSQQVLAKFESLAQIMAGRWLGAAGIGVLWALASAVLLRRSKRVGLSVQPLLLIALLVLSVPEEGSAGGVLMATFAIAAVLSVVVAIVFIRPSRSPAHVRDRFDAFRWHVDRMQNLGQ